MRLRVKFELRNLWMTQKGIQNNARDYSNTDYLKESTRFSKMQAKSLFDTKWRRNSIEDSRTGFVRDKHSHPERREIFNQNESVSWASKGGGKLVFQVMQICWIVEWYAIQMPGTIVVQYSNNHFVNGLVFKLPFEHQSGIQMASTMVSCIWIANHLNKIQVKAHYSDVSAI